MKNFKDDKREQKRIEKLIQKATKNMHVAVGIIQDEPHDKKFTMVDLAMVHEYGSKDGRIPDRSFIRSTCDAKREEHINWLKDLEARVFKDQLTVKQALSIMGEVVSKDMVQTINNFIPPPLKPATIKRKKSSKPLIDTGRLKGSITHEVRGLL